MLIPDKKRNEEVTKERQLGRKPPNRHVTGDWRRRDDDKQLAMRRRPGYSEEAELIRAIRRRAVKRATLSDGGTLRGF